MLLVHNVLWVALGAILGALLRWGFQLGLPFSGTDFPWATFWANSLGCFLIGVAWVLFKDASSLKWVLFVMVGFLGAFTTFSTLALDVVRLFMAERFLLGFGYMMLSNGLGVLMVFLGMRLGMLLR